MNEPMRKKSASSDSELSDGWSLVEHPDTVPLAPRSSDMTPLLHSPLSQMLSTAQLQASSVCHHPMSPSDETSSDAESVEIIQEDSRIADFVFPHGISRITNIITGAADKEESEREKDQVEVKEVMLNEPGSEYLIGTSIYSNEWFRLLMFISSLVALLLLLVSYTSLFFKEQAFSKSDGLIVLPDEDLSSLIADLALLKEENNRLKGELNMIKYEYGNDKKMSVKPEEPLEITATDDIIGLEVISDDSPLGMESMNFKPLTISLDSNQAGEKLSSDQPKDTINLKQKRIEDLVQLENNIKIFATNLGLKNIVVSSYNIAKNLDSINSIVKNLKSVIDKETSSKKENKKLQLEQKLAKLHNKIEQDFKKSIEKVAKRVSKFHDEFLGAFCRIKGGVSDADNIDCNKFDLHRKDNHKKFKEHEEEFKIKSKNFVKSESFTSDIRASSDKEKSSSEDVSNPDKINQGTDNFKIRFKRNNELNKGYNSNSDSTVNQHKNNKHENTNYDYKHIKNDKYTEKHHKSRKEPHYSKQQNAEADKNVNKDYLEDNNNVEKTKNVQDPNIRFKEEKKKEKHRKNNDYSSEIKNEDWKKEKKNKYEEKLKSESNFLKNNEHANDIKNEDLNSSEEVSTRYEEKKDRKAKIEEYKCPKKNCEKKFEQKINKNSQKFIKSEQEFGKFGNSGKNPSGPSTLHNESIYLKIVNGNGKRKVEPNGEWYLDLGEVRNQKRLRRAVRDRSGWLFDRALVRDWCRTNSGSSLCASFGQICDYCV